MTELPVHRLEEWRALEIPGQTLGDSDRRLVNSLGSEQGARVVVDELVTGVRVRARAWVGVLRFEAFEVHVVPKLAGENLGLVRLLEFVSGIGALRRAAGRRELHVEARNLFDLVALLFLDEAERICQAGLRADYVERQDDLPLLRGRLVVREQLLRRHALPDRLVCRYEERSHDVLDNRVLGAAAERVARRVRDEGLRRRAFSLVELFADACDWRAFDPVDARRSVDYSRLNEHYREGHELAWLVFDDAGIDDIFVHGERTSFAFLVDMNRLFERFMERFAVRALGDRWRVETQRSRSIVWDPERRRAYSTIRPDIVVSPVDRPDDRVTVDAKYKLYDRRNVDAGDVAQSFVYAYAHSGRDAELPKAAIAYPSSSSAFVMQTLAIRRADSLAAAELTVVGIPIPEALDECESGARGPILDGFHDVVASAVAADEAVATAGAYV